MECRFTDYESRQYVVTWCATLKAAYVCKKASLLREIELSPDFIWCHRGKNIYRFKLTRNITAKTLICVSGMYIVYMWMHLISTVRKDVLWFELLQATTSRCNELFTRSEIEHSMSETGGISKIRQRTRFTVLSEDGHRAHHRNILFRCSLISEHDTGQSPETEWSEMWCSITRTIISVW